MIRTALAIAAALAAAPPLAAPADWLNQTTPTATPALPTPLGVQSPTMPPLPNATPTTLPTPSTTSAPTASPSATATPVYKYRYAPTQNPSAAPDSPEILEVDLNDNHLSPHGKIMIRVLTSPNVVKVITRSNGHTGTLTQDAPGEFLGNGSIPGIPFIAKGWKVNIEFVASTADGRTTSVKVPVTLG